MLKRDWNRTSSVPKINFTKKVEFFDPRDNKAGKE